MTEPKIVRATCPMDSQDNAVHLASVVRDALAKHRWVRLDLTDHPVGWPSGVERFLQHVSMGGALESGLLQVVGGDERTMRTLREKLGVAR